MHDFARVHDLATVYLADALVPQANPENRFFPGQRLDRGHGLYRIYLEGADLLKSVSDSDVEQSQGGIGTTPRVFTGGRYFGGRVIRLGVSGTFGSRI